MPLTDPNSEEGYAHAVAINRSQLQVNSLVASCNLIQIVYPGEEVSCT